MNHRSLAFRLSVWYTLLISVTFALVGAGTFLFLQHYLRSNLRDSLKYRSAQVEQLLRQAPSTVTDDVLSHDIEIRLAPEFNNRFVRVTRLPSNTVFRSGLPFDRSFDPALIDQKAKMAVTTRPSLVPTIDDDLHMMLGAQRINVPSGSYLVDIGISTAPIEAVLERLMNMLALLLPVLIACAAAGAYFLVSRALRPVDRIAQTAEQMSLQNLSLRLPVVPTGDALERLSISMNTMLGRLRDSVQTSRRFLADASHELRTPLTVIKGELQEIASGTELDNAELRERVGSVLEEVGRLEHLVSGLLVLSRLDAGETQRVRTDVDLAELARGTAEQMRLMAEDRGLAMELSGLQEAVVRGDEGRLKQIVVNLLDNAIRFTPRGGTVTLATRADRDGARLEVSDTGVGIPDEAVEQVFERFFRVDQARSRDDGGAGLGLSIVKSICSMHGAVVEVQSRLGAGSCFCVTFPQRMGNAADAGPPQAAAPTALDRTAVASTQGVGAGAGHDSLSV